MILLLTLACTGPLPDDSSAAPVAPAAGVEYYVWDYVCTGTDRMDAAPFMPLAGRDPLFAMHLINHDGDAWQTTEDLEWREGVDTSAPIEAGCEDGIRGRVTIAYLADE